MSTTRLLKVSSRLVTRGFPNLAEGLLLVTGTIKPVCVLLKGKRRPFCVRAIKIRLPQDRKTYTSIEKILITAQEIPHRGKAFVDIDRTKHLKTLWYEDKDGNILSHNKKTFDVPAGAVYQVSRFPSTLITNHLRFVDRKEVDNCLKVSWEGRS